jgi:hypothetical protein
MKDERLGGSAWIVATGMMIVTMALHPTGHDLVEPGRFEAMAARNMVVHGLAIASLPLAFLGALALARRAVEPLRLGLAALVVYGFALVAAMLAASANGFVAPPLIRELIEHPDSAVPEALLDYSHHFNHAFTHLYVVGSSAAILLWSIALLRTGLGRGCLRPRRGSRAADRPHRRPPAHGRARLRPGGAGAGRVDDRGGRVARARALARPVHER